jgi:hypothetical protein
MTMPMVHRDIDPYEKSIYDCMRWGWMFSVLQTGPTQKP